MTDALPRLGCPTCDAFLAKSAPRQPRYGSLNGLGPSVVVPDGYPELHYGFRLERDGNACPSCHRTIVVIEDHPRGHGSTTHIELRPRTG